eukprot:COSAG01_NODE_48857_length_377_cov_0.924460_1_plen_75_part_01
MLLSSCRLLVAATAVRIIVAPAGASPKRAQKYDVFSQHFLPWLQRGIDEAGLRQKQPLLRTSLALREGRYGRGLF